MNKDEKLIAEQYQTVKEFAFPTRGLKWNSDYEIAQSILAVAQRIEGLTNQKKLTTFAKRLEQLYFDISDFGERLESQLNSPDRA